jgi:hypothetical protein
MISPPATDAGAGPLNGLERFSRGIEQGFHRPSQQEAVPATKSG